MDTWGSLRALDPVSRKRAIPRLIKSWTESSSIDVFCISSSATRGGKGSDWAVDWVVDWVVDRGSERGADLGGLQFSPAVVLDSSRTGFWRRVGQG